MTDDEIFIVSLFQDLREYQIKALPLLVFETFPITFCSDCCIRNSFDTNLAKATASIESEKKMGDLWQNILLEIGIFVFLGVLYYFYQRKKIIRYELNKGPMVMGLVLQSCLADKKDQPEPQLDALIESLDDYLQNKIAQPPVAHLKLYMATPECSVELRQVIQEALGEMEYEHGKK